MKKYLAVLMAALLVILAGCGSGNGTSGQTTNTSSAIDAVSADEVDTTVSKSDQDATFNESIATKITLAGASASISGSGASQKDGVITIQQEGTYVVSGTLEDGQLIVDAADTEKVQVVLKGASIHCSNHAALFIKQADKVFLTLAEGTENTLSSGGSYTLGDDDSNVDSTIFSRADLTMNGSGSLAVNAAYKHAVVSKDDLVVTGGQYTVKAENGGGLYGKDCVKITGGTFTIQTGTDGIQASNAEKEDKGYVYISGGTFHVTAGTDGIQAETVLRIDDGTFQITSGGGSANASTDKNGTDAPGWGMWGPGGGKDTTQTTETADTSDSAKGMKAGASLSLRGGTFTIDSSDDSIHCNGTVTISGGTFSLKSGDDGVHADDALLIEGGTITISQSYEGLEGLNVTIHGGKIQVVASDDGINSAGGSDTADQGRPGKNHFSVSEDSEIFIKITGGTVNVDAGGDGLDSNGNLFMEGGTVYVSGSADNGNGALDYEGTATITGGAIVAAGMSGMAQGFSDSSTQYSILNNFSTSFSSGDAITLKDSSGKVLASYTPAKAYNSVVVSSPELKKGETYTLAAGSQSESLTLASVVTSNGSGGMGGGMMGGGKGGPQPGGKER